MMTHLMSIIAILVYVLTELGCFQCYVKKKSKCTFDHVVVEKSENSTNWK